MPSKLVAPEQLLQAIFAHTNRLSWQQRQFILRFLGGQDDKPPQELIDSTSIANNNENENESAIRQVLLHEETRTEISSSINNSNRSYNIVDQIVFEMDYSSGCWRKLRRRIRMVNKEDRENGSGSGRVSSSSSSTTTTTSRRERRERDRRLATTTSASAASDFSSFFTFTNIDDIPTDGRPSLRPRQPDTRDVNLRQQSAVNDTDAAAAAFSSNEYTSWHRSNRGSSSSSGCGR